MGLKWEILGACLLLLSITTIASAHSSIPGLKIFNVVRFGAVPNGKTDSTLAFSKAWSEACVWGKGNPRVVVPGGAFLIGPIIFKGPCKTGITFQVKGDVIASSNLKLYKPDWIQFLYINNLLVTGQGRFDGQGALAWPFNDCNKSKFCKRRLPMSLSFGFITNSTIQHITSVNSKNFHYHLFACANLKMKDLTITAPGDSPNTDGIHIGVSTNIKISKAVIKTGDDCISVGPGSTNVQISGVYCGPGHGISVGSLGKTPNEKDVVGLSVTNCTFVGTTNGLRIKTWQETPTASSAYNLTFENIVMKDVDNPIIIDQKYCPHNTCGQKSPSKVKLSNIKFRNIKGESRAKAAVNLLCSDAAPCKDIELSNINLKYIGKEGEAVSTCKNAKVKSFGYVYPSPCR